MCERNEVYNGSFVYGRRPDYTFPDGWQPAGGGPGTQWFWEGTPPGPREVKIQNPAGLPAGIRQEQHVYIPVGERQRWLVRVSLRAATPGKRGYVKVFFTTAEGYPLGVLELNYTLSDQSKTYQDVVMTPAGTTAVILEAGIAGDGSLWISEVSFTRLYPLQRLRLDSQGRVFVNHVKTVGEITKPIRLQEPVSVHARVEADIRNLAYWRDSVKVYGSEGVPLKTDSEGKALVASARNYTGAEETVSTTDTWIRSAARDVSVQTTYSFAVRNGGTSDAVIRVSISPNILFWIPDGPEIKLSPGGDGGAGPQSLSPLRQCGL